MLPANNTACNNRLINHFKYVSLAELEETWIKLLSESRKKASYNATQMRVPPTIGVDISFFTIKSTNERAQVITAAEIPNISQILYSKYGVDHPDL